MDQWLPFGVKGMEQWQSIWGPDRADRGRLSTAAEKAQGLAAEVDDATIYAPRARLDALPWRCSGSPARVPGRHRFG